MWIYGGNFSRDFQQHTDGRGPWLCLEVVRQRIEAECQELGTETLAPHASSDVASVVKIGLQQVPGYADDAAGNTHQLTILACMANNLLDALLADFRRHGPFRSPEIQGFLLGLRWNSVWCKESQVEQVLCPGGIA